MAEKQSGDSGLDNRVEEIRTVMAMPKMSIRKASGILDVSSSTLHAWYQKHGSEHGLPPLPSQREASRRMRLAVGEERDAKIRSALAQGQAPEDISGMHPRTVSRGLRKMRQSGEKVPGKGRYSASRGKKKKPTT